MGFDRENWQFRRFCQIFQIKQIRLSIYKLEGVCVFVASFETFGSGSFGGPLRGPVGFGGPLGVRWVLVSNPEASRKPRKSLSRSPLE